MNAPHFYNRTDVRDFLFEQLFDWQPLNFPKNRCSFERSFDKKNKKFFKKVLTNVLHYGIIIIEREVINYEESIHKEF